MNVAFISKYDVLVSLHIHIHSCPPKTIFIAYYILHFLSIALLILFYAYVLPWAIQIVRFVSSCGEQLKVGWDRQPRIN